jgi:hypothetical protein
MVRRVRHDEVFSAGDTIAMSGLGKILRFVWTHSPRHVLTRVGARYAGRRFDYAASTVYRAAANARPAHFIDRWERYRRVLRNSGFSGESGGLQFAGTTVLELGSGPLLGWAPLALFLGASRYYVTEPNATFDSAADPALRPYWVRYFDELVANYGALMTFDEFMVRLKSARRGTLKEFETCTIDIILSNSVLEHIACNDLTGVLEELSRLSCPAVRYLHAVDFGPHGAVRQFGDIYAVARDADLSRGLINLLKPTEIRRRLSEHGFSGNTCTYKRIPVDRKKIHPYWRRFSEDDLECGVALFVGASQPGFPVIAE